METFLATKLFAVEDIVPVSGNYVCLPCGYVQYFEAGSQFTECLMCLAGTENGPARFQTPEADFWEFAE